MDGIQGVLSLTPDPPILPIFTTFKFIHRAAQKLQSSEEQFHALIYSIAELLQTLNSEHRANRLLNDNISELLEALLKPVHFLSFNTTY